MKIDYSNLEKKINIRFKDKSLLIKSLTHKSFDKKNNYEKIEFLGDNRDCSKDSRFLSSVGYVHKDNLVGKAQFIFFSSDKSVGSIFSFWKWKRSLRFNRFFKKIN